MCVQHSVCVCARARMRTCTHGSLPNPLAKWNPGFFFFFNCGSSSCSSRAEETVKYFTAPAIPQRLLVQNPFPALFDCMCARTHVRVWRCVRQRTPSARYLLRSTPEGAFSSNLFTPSQPAPDIKENLGREHQPPNRILLHHYSLCFFYFVFP